MNAETQPDRAFRLRVSYDGTGYVGFQRQPGQRTIQEVLEHAAWRLTGEHRRIGYAGRTDAGVHALGQVISLETAQNLTERTVLAGLNAHLPPEIVVWEATQVPLGFDPRRTALSRTYVYRIENRQWPTPFLRRYSWHVRERLDETAMQQAVAGLPGVRDLAALTQKSGVMLPSTSRRIDQVQVSRKGDLVSVTIEANAFLPHVVRNLVGTLVWIGRGRRSANEFETLLASRDRRQAGPAAPGHGLFLVRVRYPDDEEPAAKEKESAGVQNLLGED